MAYWNLDKYAGLARSEFILDASTVTATTLATMVTKVGTGAVSIPATLVTPGGRISMNTTAAADTATLTLPPSMGNSGGSLAALLVEVSGLRCATARGTFALEIWQSNTVRSGMIWDSSGIVLSTRANAAPTLTAIAKQGDFSALDNTDIGFLAHTHASIDHALWGQVGGAKVAIPVGSDLRGTWKVRLHSTGTTAATEISFRQLKVTAIWGTPGTTIQRVY